MWSISSRCRQESVYLLRTWCLYTWSCLDNIIIIHFSINCSTVICSPTVILMLSWEKPLVNPMAPGSIFYHISFQSTFICIFTFPIYIIKYHKYIYLIILSLSDLTFASYCEGINNPFIALVARFLFVCVGTRDFWGASYWIDTLVLKNWGKYLRYYCCITLSSSRKTNASSRRSKKDFWRRCRGVYAKSQHTKYPSQSLSLALHYLPFASRFPLPHFTLAVLFSLSFPISSSFPFCLLVC